MLSSSPSSTITIGKLTNTHGLKGFLKLTLSNAHYKDIFADFKTCYIADRFYTIESFSLTPKCILLKILGINSIEAAEKIKGAELSVAAETVTSKDTALFSETWLGYAVLDENKTCIGLVDDIIYTGSNDVLSVINADEEILIPVTDEFLLKVNHPEKTLLVNKPNYA